MKGGAIFAEVYFWKVLEFHDNDQQIICRRGIRDKKKRQRERERERERRRRKKKREEEEI